MAIFVRPKLPQNTGKKSESESVPACPPPSPHTSRPDLIPSNWTTQLDKVELSGRVGRISRFGCRTIVIIKKRARSYEREGSCRIQGGREKRA